MTRRRWTADEDALVRQRYPHEPTRVLAALLGRPLRAVYQRARALDVAKSAAYLASPVACRLRRGDQVGAATRFKPGQVPPNKGLRRPGWHRGRMRETQFRSGVRQGVAAQNWRPLGTILIDSDGYQRIKVREAAPGEATGFGNTRVWALLQRHLWEQAHGPIPAGHALVFRDGNRQHVALDNLELVPRAELMRRNSIHRLPAPIVETLQALGALTRQIRKREQHAQEQDQ